MKANVKLVWRLSGPIRSLNYFNLKTKYICDSRFLQRCRLIADSWYGSDRYF